MRPIPPAMKRRMEASPFYKRCVFDTEDCSGRIEWDHVFTYAGRQINEVWAILPTCHWHHANIARFRKQSERIALARATDEDLAKYPRRDWSRYRSV